jgi:hypothetical protein
MKKRILALALALCASSASLDVQAAPPATGDAARHHVLVQVSPDVRIDVIEEGQGTSSEHLLHAQDDMTK